MTTPLKIVIVGAGIGGLACAIASRRQGLEVLVLERTEKLMPIGAGIQIPPNASRIWAKYGLIEKLRDHSVVLEETQLKRWQDGEFLCARSIGEKMDERWPWLVIHRADYQRLLVEECQRLGVVLRFSCEVRRVNVEITGVLLSNGEVVSGDVIVGADGLWSTLRTYVLGYDSPPQETGDLAYRGTFSRSSLLALDDREVDALCEKKVSAVWIGPSSHAVFYPVRRNQEFNLVMTRPDDLPHDVKTREGNLEEMMTLFKGWDPVLTKILTAFSFVLKWKMMHHNELESWTRNKVVLLGDACHPSLPYQAQGAAMAVEDGAIIAVLLGLYHRAGNQSVSHLTLQETLKLYETVQKARTTTIHLGSISNQQLYHLDDGAEQEERDRILKSARWEEKHEGESERFIWIDVRYQKAIVGRDAIGDATQIWEEARKSTKSRRELM